MAKNLQCSIKGNKKDVKKRDKKEGFGKNKIYAKENSQNKHSVC